MTFSFSKRIKFTLVLMLLCSCAAQAHDDEPHNAKTPAVIELDQLSDFLAEDTFSDNIRVDYRVAKGKRVSGENLIKAKAGQSIILSVTSDRSDSLHLHGYDLHLDINPNEEARLEFVAEHTGRFEFELHDSHLDLGVLEVYPR